MVPLLQRLGIHADDLRCETSFSFKAGRSTLVEDTMSALRERRPRLDVLVKRGDRNAFVLEAKAPDRELTDDDRLQAISYARLVHPMAPYALVTNGRETRLYDTVTRQPIAPQDVRLDGNFEISLPGSDDFDALACFLRLTPENLLRFCHVQMSDGIRMLRGSPADLTRKYIPELHIPRAIVGRALQDFLHHSSQPTFALVADSGLGKTCCMCYQAIQLLEAGQPVLFLRGSELEQPLLSRLAEEFAWTFSEALSPPVLVRRLSQVAGDRHLIIFLDALDEWADAGAYRQLGTLSKHLSDTRVKLVVSCKSLTWPAFLEHLGAPTDFAAHVATHSAQPGLAFGPLEDQEFYSALRKYKEVYGFSGVWDKNLLEEAKRSPFFMRIAFEVAKEYKLKELRDTTREIFERYYNYCLAHTQRRDLSERVLVATANALFEENIDRVEVIRLRQLLGLRLTEELPADLFLSGILEKIGESGDSAAVRFAFDGLRNYIIAFKARRWHEQKPDTFADQIQHLSSGGIREESLVAYYKLAVEEHKRLLDRDVYYPALRYLNAYKSIIQRHFAAFAAAFPPGDLEKAGLVLEANLRTNQPFGHGLRLLGSDQPIVLIIPTTSTKAWMSDSMLRFGASGLSNRLAPDWLHGVDPYHELLRVNFARLVPQIIRKGELNEEAAPDLSRELLAAAVLSKPEILNEPNRGPGQESLPLKAGRIKYWCLFQQHWMRLEDELLQAKISSGELPVQWQGSHISYSPPPLTEEERRDLQRRCHALASVGIEIDRPRYIPFDPLANRLKTAVSSLRDTDAMIEGPVFLEAEDWWRRVPWRSATEVDLLDYLRRFIYSFLLNYQRIVDTNFPTLSQHFTLHRALPVLVRTGIGNSSDGALYDRGMFIDFLAPSGFDLDENIVEVVGERDLARNFRRNEKIESSGRLYNRVLTWAGSAGEVLAGNRRHYPDLRFRTSLTVLRDWTYSWIESEIEEVGQALADLYGAGAVKFRA